MPTGIFQRINVICFAVLPVSSLAYFDMSLCEAVYQPGYTRICLAAGMATILQLAYLVALVSSSADKGRSLHPSFPPR